MTPGYPRTPLTAQPASSSLAALLEAKPTRPLRSTTSLATPPLPPLAPPPTLLQGDAGEDRWRKLCARILPLFNGEHMQGAVEENNEAVRALLLLRGEEDAWREIERVVRVGMASVVRRVYAVAGVAPQFDGGATGLSVKGLVEGPAAAGPAADGVVLDALALVWAQLVAAHVLPYLEAVFLPLRQYGGSGGRSVRDAVLACFRDCVVLPLLPLIDRVAQGVAASAAAAAEGRWVAVAAAAQMLAALAALAPDDRGPLYVSARALAAAQYC
ncbi:hypothetical protein LPJ53_006051 [Coemansia erecta]|uniref:Uncharacterized protein n=1 Tax=Coemansia erecta TaxID=147472 RepID=A0A9W7XTL7_9FUNG|nr:hypothetical protein LPJ53_006051 [Coemansia erecta]